MPKRRRQASAWRVCALDHWRSAGGARTGLLRKNPPDAIDGFVLGPTTLIAHHACAKGTSTYRRKRQQEQQSSPPSAAHYARSARRAGRRPFDVGAFQKCPAK